MISLPFTDRILLCFLLFSFALPANAQSDSAYQTLIAKAGLLHLQKDYKNAIILYEQAFRLQKPDALNAYNAAGVYALDHNTDKACYYLNLALSAGWTEAGWLAADPYFDHLRQTAAQQWEKILQKAFTAEQQYERTLKLPDVRKQLNLMALQDQQLRYKRVQTNNESVATGIEQKINSSDLSNLNTARQLIIQYGWPKISDIGKDGQHNLWLIVQHADQDILFQRTALLAMEKHTGTPEIDMENYAFLYDRVQCNLNYKQLYGTQVVWTNHGGANGFRPIIQEDAVDDRRRALGLLPLKFYALTYGFTYLNKTPAQAKQQDSADQAYTRQLIDSARYFYSKQAFQKVYDYYNTASAVSGGMTDAENYEAAILFAKIAAVNNEQPYKDISLDFLNLLYLRGVLRKEQLQDQPIFKILYTQQRWAGLLQ